MRNSDNLLRPGTRPCLTTMYQVLAALLIGLTPLAVTAATIVVTSPDDTSPVAATTCTLRQAILSMNAASLKGNCGNTGAAFGTGDLITFAAAAVTGGTNSHSVTLTDSADATGAVGGTLVVTAANVTIDASSWPTFASPFRGSLGIGKDGNANDGRAIRGTGSSTLTLNSLLLVGGKATPDCGGSARGGAVCMPGPNSTLNLLNSTLYGNSAVDGGGVFVDGTLNVNGSAVLNNSSSGSGAGIFVIGTANVTDTYLSSNLATTNGGGILCAGSLTLTGSTLVQNTAIHGGGVAGSDNSGCALIVKNSTLFFNSANTQGGGIYNSGPVTLTHATVVYNSAPTGAEIYEAFFAEAVKLGNSIVAGPGASEIVGGTLSSTFSITSLAGLNLGGFQDNGGPAPTLLPGAGSTAIDAVPLASCSLATDQRGVARPQGSACDVGAVEVKVPKLTAAVSGGGAVSAGASPVPASGSISNCTTSCSAFYYENASVTLTATPATGWHFAAWTGDCVSSATVVMSADRTCTATFARNTHAIGGSITNLAGSGLKLHLNYGVGNDEDLTPTNGATTFAFGAAVPFGLTYTVSVITQPANLSQTCNVTGNATGPMPDSDVAAPVACTTNSYTIGGGVTGLTGAGLVLKLNGGGDLAVSGSSFTFLSTIASGSNYIVSVGTQPTGQTCTVGSGSGTVTNANITNVAISCGAAQAQLTLTVDDSHDYARYGQLSTYLVTLENSGAATANSVAVLASTPGNGLDLANASWQCIGGGNGAVCAANGTGALSDTVTLPVSRTLTWIVTAPVRTATSATTAEMDVDATGATTVGNVNKLVLYRDGFNVANGGGTGSADPEPTVAGMPGEGASEMFSLPRSSGSQIETVKQIRIGDRRVRVHRAALGMTSYVRLFAHDADGTERASAWAAVAPAAQLVLGRVDGVVLLEGAEQSLELR